MVEKARLIVPKQESANVGWHRVTWGVTKSTLLERDERRFEAHSYLSDGFGRRAALESRAVGGWSRLGDAARVWQPSRLKGISVGPRRGVPFLAAGQVYEAAPSARKWLSFAHTPSAKDRYVEAGVLLLSCSGTVGRVTVAHAPHLNRLITHDLRRIEPRDERIWGWLYAYMRTTSFRAMATGTHYGHVIKHLETSHVAALPLIDLDHERLSYFNAAVRRIFGSRDRAHALVAEAEGLFADALGGAPSGGWLDRPFIVPARSLSEGRRRLDGYHHNAYAQAISKQVAGTATRLQRLDEVTERIWWPGRFRRVLGDQGTPYVSAMDLFDVNPPAPKRIYAGLVPNAEDYFLQPGWLVMARSGQIYGLNGRVFMASERHARAFVSEDLIRIVPRATSIRPGYLITALGHPTLGRPLVVRQAYGTSIPHLEPADLASLTVPRLAQKVEGAISDRMEEVTRLRSEADDLEDTITRRAEDVIEVFLQDDT